MQLKPRGLLAAFCICAIGAGASAQTVAPEAEASAAAPAASAASGAAAASNVATDIAAAVQYYNINYKINDDGSYTEERAWANKVLKQRALESAKSVSIGYSTSIQKVEVVQAYTLKADGSRVEVPKSNYQVQTNGGQGDNAPVFSDRTLMTVVFPDLAVGDTIVFDYRLTGSQPMFDRQFSDAETFSRQAYYGEVNVSFDAPAGLPVRHEAWFMEPTRDEVVDGRRINQWRWRNTQPLKPDPAPPLFEFENNPGLVYSTFASYEDIAKAYGARAMPKAAVTERIRKLADEIVGTRTEPRAVAEALHDWIATRITYADNSIGLGAVVPHDLDFVLDNRMGDCKDQATLLQALLAAKGIQSTQGLINAGGLYRLPRMPATEVVNHVIDYLPALDLFIDPTASDTPFGMLPRGDIGKPIFLVDGYREGMRTPVPAPGADRQTLRMHMKVTADGGVEGEEEIAQEGVYAVYTRARMRNANPERVAQVGDAFFKRLGVNGAGSFDFPDATALSDRYSYRLNFKADQVLPVPGALAVLPIFATEAAIAGSVASANAPVPEQGESACGNVYSQEDYVIEFDPSIKISALPPNLTAEGADTRYEAQYTSDGQQVRIHRVLDDRTTGPTCSPDFLRQYRALMQKARANLKAQIVYQ